MCACGSRMYKSGDLFVVGAFNNCSQTEAFTTMRFAKKLNVFWYDYDIIHLNATIYRQDGKRRRKLHQ